MTWKITSIFFLDQQLQVLYKVYHKWTIIKLLLLGLVILMEKVCLFIVRVTLSKVSK